MAILNTTLIENTLTNRISQTTSTTSTDAILLTALSVNQISPNVKNSVASLAELPDILDNNIPNGFIVYIESINIHVVASNYQWLSLDGRLYRDDSLPVSIWSWGINTAGQLGDNTVLAKVSPVSVVGGFTDWYQISAGADHSAAIRSNGTLWTWGVSCCGVLGAGPVTVRSSPGSVIGGFTDWCRVSAGALHDAAIRTNGTLWAWGRNDLGQLGDGTIVNRSSPVSVVGGFTDWRQVSARGYHTLAIRSNGTLWSWGNNYRGQLGHNTAPACVRSSPVEVVGGFADWCQICVGGESSFALRTNGTLWVWGRNDFGQLGDGGVTCRSSPISVVGGFTNWCQVSTSGSHSAAIRTNGTLWTWGINSSGQLGTGNVTARSSPGSVIGGFTDWCQVSAGGVHTAAIRTNGTLWAWGSNAGRAIGDNTIINRSSPVLVAGGFTNWCCISAGGNHNLGLRPS